MFLRAGTTWTEEATLFVAGGVTGGGFGRSIALSADATRALVGAPLGAFGRESARVFVRSGTAWTEEAALVATGAAGDHFGSSVALAADGTRAVVGSSTATVAGASTGAAHVFLRSGATWTEEATLLASDGTTGDLFGDSVALNADGSRCAVGASADDTVAGTDAGSVRVFLRGGTTWAVESTLLAPRAASSGFGESIALSGDGSRLVAGHNTSGGARGGASVFLRSGLTWIDATTLVPADGAASDAFGESVALSADGDWVLVGAPSDETVGGMRAGSARVFSLSL